MATNDTKVLLTMDLEAPMQLHGIRLGFAPAHGTPAGIVIERWSDVSKRYRPLHYFARSCDDQFAMEEGKQRKSMKDLTCETMSARATSITFTLAVDDDNVTTSDEFWFLSQISKLRIVFHPMDSSQETVRRCYNTSIQVLGSCLCHGHASECEMAAQSGSKILPKCKCLHETEGDQCDSCEALFNQREWHAGWKRQANACQACACNGRADSCFYDFDRKQGVCVGCRNSSGSSCERCKSFFYSVNSSCSACACNLTGSLSNLCDQVSGQCDCLPRFSGRDCSVQS